MNVTAESGLLSCDLGIECLMKGLQVIWQTGTGSLCPDMRFWLRSILSMADKPVMSKTSTLPLPLCTLYSN